MPEIHVDILPYNQKKVKKNSSPSFSLVLFGRTENFQMPFEKSSLLHALLFGINKCKFHLPKFAIDSFKIGRFLLIIAQQSTILCIPHCMSKFSLPHGALAKFCFAFYWHYFLSILHKNYILFSTLAKNPQFLYFYTLFSKKSPFLSYFSVRALKILHFFTIIQIQVK